MKSEKKGQELNDIRKDVMLLETDIKRLDRAIRNPKRVIPIIRLKTVESRLKKEYKAALIKLHTLENRLIDLGRGPIYGIHRVPQIKTNQYSN